MSSATRPHDRYQDRHLDHRCDTVKPGRVMLTVASLATILIVLFSSAAQAAILHTAKVSTSPPPLGRVELTPMPQIQPPPEWLPADVVCASLVRQLDGWFDVVLGPGRKPVECVSGLRAPDGEPVGGLHWVNARRTQIMALNNSWFSLGIIAHEVGHAVERRLLTTASREELRTTLQEVAHVPWNDCGREDWVCGSERWADGYSQLVVGPNEALVLPGYSRLTITKALAEPRLASKLANPAESKALESLAGGGVWGRPS